MSPANKGGGQARGRAGPASPPPAGGLPAPRALAPAAPGERPGDQPESPSQPAEAPARRRGAGRPRHDPETRVPLGPRLALIAKNRGLTHEQLRQRVGVSKSTFSMWVNKKSYPTLDQVVALCRELNVSADVLLGLAPIVIE